MTDEELVKACAEKVMGWVDRSYAWAYECEDGQYRFAAQNQSHTCTQCGDTVEAWNPLTSDADACMVLDKMRREGWDYGVCGWTMSYGTPYFSCGFEKQGEKDAYKSTSRSRGYAIVNAALKAKGFKEVEFLGIEQVGLYGTHGA